MINTKSGMANNTMNNPAQKFTLDMSPQSAGCIDLPDEDILDMFMITQY